MAGLLRFFSLAVLAHATAAQKDCLTGTQACSTSIASVKLDGETYCCPFQTDFINAELLGGIPYCTCEIDGTGGIGGGADTPRECATDESQCANTDILGVVNGFTFCCDSFSTAIGVQHQDGVSTCVCAGIAGEGGGNGGVDCVSGVAQCANSVSTTEVNGELYCCADDTDTLSSSKGTNGEFSCKCSKGNGKDDVSAGSCSVGDACANNPNKTPFQDKLVCCQTGNAIITGSTCACIGDGGQGGTGMSTEAIIGIALGSAGAVGLAGAGMFAYSRSQSNKQSTTDGFGFASMHKTPQYSDVDI